jgi:hypothetical protein
VPFLPPRPVAPARCACGAEITLEMERDLGECCDCMAEAAGVSNRSLTAGTVRPAQLNSLGA